MTSNNLTYISWEDVQEINDIKDSLDNMPCLVGRQARVQGGGVTDEAKEQKKYLNYLIDTLFDEKEKYIEILIKKLFKMYKAYGFLYDEIKGIYYNCLIQVMYTEKYRGVSSVSAIAFGRSRDELKSRREKKNGIVGISASFRPFLQDKAKQRECKKHKKIECADCKPMGAMIFTSLDTNPVEAHLGENNEEDSKSFDSEVILSLALLSWRHLGVLYGKDFIKKNNITDRILKDVVKVVKGGTHEV